ncbi:MAG: enoyl-CoA hydratase/isomerase family protein [Chloroflexi bacterium]|jgi:2-(1,2-epoxy-1,2-dihydrophenyl)acetyl-CoA isomerase|nr:enoyl-CoA hydratase/isomerase family protein [Chloroflexota bacterium]MBT7081201.1 enoyl-CoA hydratase/isomerase family protein [Chloroflexota bacterium]MBT7290256.1 enoyl-CoA hydratase/isomerase family protein [Chloroflexota bacterium]
MDYKNIIYEKDGAVAILTLNRPDVLNAYNVAMVREMAQAIDDAAVDGNIRALIITGAGRGFCSGVDNRDPAEPLLGVPAIIKYKWRLYPIISRLWDFDKPVICAINGMTAGAGTALAMICDIRIASDMSKFLMVWAKRGMVPDNGASYFLVRLIGLSKAYELTFSGDSIDATEMERIGLVSKVVPHNELLSEAKNLAQHLSKGSPIATQLSKRLIRNATKEKDLFAQMELEGNFQRIATSTDEFKEGK